MASPFRLDGFPLRTQSRGQHTRLQAKEMGSPFHGCRVLRVGQAGRGQWEASWKQGSKARGEEKTGLEELLASCPFSGCRKLKSGLRRGHTPPILPPP